MAQLSFSFSGPDGQWEAASGIHDDGNPFHWRIEVCSDGEFVVCHSDHELLIGVDELQPFETFRKACWWCQREEDAACEAMANL